MIKEFGSNQPVDAVCSFGKGLFENHIWNIRPPGIELHQGSNLEIWLGFGCGIEILSNQTEKWENFRSFYGEFVIETMLKIVPNQIAKSLNLKGELDMIKASKIKIFKWDEAQIMEETTISTLLNMGLSMSKKTINDALSIPTLTYPNFKKCYGIEFDEPQIFVDEGYFMISTDLLVKPASLNCKEDDQIYQTEPPKSGFYKETIA